jgi:DNA-binding MarR family transcriptional regulator
MDNVPWLTDEEREAWIGLARVLVELPLSLDSQLQRDSGLAMADYMVLAMLSEHEHHSMRMSALAAVASASQSRLSRIVARLEEAGYVSRVMAPDDRRAVIATLTEAGFDKLLRAAPGHLRQVRSLVFDRLDADEVRSLTGIAAALLGTDCVASVDAVEMPAVELPSIRGRAAV